MSSQTDTLLLIALICAVGYLVYLDWLRQGEIDFLSEEVLKMRRASEGKAESVSQT